MWHIAKLGKTGGDSLHISGGETISLSAIRETYEGWMPDFMAYN